MFKLKFSSSIRKPPSKSLSELAKELKYVLCRSMIDM